MVKHTLCQLRPKCRLRSLHVMAQDSLDQRNHVTWIGTGIAVCPFTLRFVIRKTIAATDPMIATIFDGLRVFPSLAGSRLDDIPCFCHLIGLPANRCLSPRDFIVASQSEGIRSDKTMLRCRSHLSNHRGPISTFGSKNFNDLYSSISRLRLFSARCFFDRLRIEADPLQLFADESYAADAGDLVGLVNVRVNGIYRHDRTA
jgi:hypothetical protein